MFFGDDEAIKGHQQFSTEEKAVKAFSSPSKLATTRITRSPTASARSGDEYSVSPSRRGQSIVSSPEDAKVFEDLVASTGVVVRSPKGGTTRIIEGGPFGISTADVDLAPPALDHPNFSPTNEIPEPAPVYNPHSVSETLSLADAALASAEEFIRSNSKDRNPYTLDPNPSELTGSFDTANKSAAGSWKQPNHITGAMKQTAGLPPWASSNARPAPIHVAGNAGASSSSSSTPASTRALDLKQNDNSFHVIANLVVDRFEEYLDAGVATLNLTEEDRRQLDRIVPESMRNNFVEAVRYRLAASSEGSQQSLHLVLRKCRALGLDREGNQNLMFAAPNTTITIYVSGKHSPERRRRYLYHLFLETTSPSILLHFYYSKNPKRKKLRDPKHNISLRMQLLTMSTFQQATL